MWALGTLTMVIVLRVASTRWLCFISFSFQVFKSLLYYWKEDIIRQCSTEISQSFPTKLRNQSWTLWKFKQEVNTHIHVFSTGQCLHSSFPLRSLRQAPFLPSFTSTILFRDRQAHTDPKWFQVLPAIQKVSSVDLRMSQAPNTILYKRL